MKVVFVQDVKDVGKTGQVKEVSDGYARNFLFPRRLALPATESQLKKLADHKAVEARHQAKADQAAQKTVEQMAQISLVFHAKVGEQQRLYGSITSADIAEALSKRLGKEIDKRRIEMEEPIKHLGTFKVAVRLAKDVIPQVTVVIEPETKAE
jgi:large subunit ribosomal protein L9